MNKPVSDDQVVIKTVAITSSRSNAEMLSDPENVLMVTEQGKINSTYELEYCKSLLSSLTSTPLFIPVLPHKKAKAMDLHQPNLQCPNLEIDSTHKQEKLCSLLLSTEKNQNSREHTVGERMYVRILDHDNLHRRLYARKC